MVGASEESATYPLFGVRYRFLRSQACSVRRGAGGGECDPSLVGVQAVVEAETTSGGTLAIRCDTPKGAPENLLLHAQIENKFREYAKARLSARHVEGVIGTMARLEELKSTRTLMDMLRAEK